MCATPKRSSGCTASAPGPTSGLLKTLRTGPSREELAQRLGARRTDLLDARLELGVALGELACDNRGYRIRGKRAAALTDDRGDAVVAIVEEAVSYHGAVYRDLPARLRDGSSGDYLAGNGPMIARSSGVLEPFMLVFARRVVPSSRSIRMLETGCGSGVYLRHAATVNPQATGIGIDLQDDVVRHCASRLAEWGLPGRFSILHADIRTPPPELAGRGKKGDATPYRLTYGKSCVPCSRGRVARGGAQGRLCRVARPGPAFRDFATMRVRMLAAATRLVDRMAANVPVRDVTNAESVFASDRAGVVRTAADTAAGTRAACGS